MPSSSTKRRVRLPPAAVRAKSPLALRVHGVCVCCGGRNVVHFGSQLPHVQCRSCGVVSPDCIQRKPPHGYQEADRPVEPLNKNQCHELIDELLDALAQEKTAHKAQSLLNKAHGDVVLICHFYVPFVLDVGAMVVAKYGFSASVEGVKESLRVMQRHATSDESNDTQQLTQKLIRLRRVLTPTGQWIQDDAESDAADLLKRKDERELQRQKHEEARRMEVLALENANKAKLRAKKIVLGLDPTLVRLPQLESVPRRIVVANGDACVVLRVVARFAYQFQWFCNGKLLPVDGDLVSGSRRSTLKIRRITKRTLGDYYCVCTNDEGAVSSPTTQVQLLAIGSRRLALRKLRTLPSGVGSVSLVPLVWSGSGRHQTLLSVISLCVGGNLSLLHAKTLTPVKMLPPIAVPPNITTTTTSTSTVSGATATAWLPAANLLAIATSPLRQPPVPSQNQPTALSPTTRKKKNTMSLPAVCEVSIYSLDQVAPPPPAAPLASPGASSPISHKPNKTTTTQSLETKASSTNSTSSSTTTTQHQPAPTPASSPPPQVLLSRLISTHSVPSLKTIECVQFLANGRLLLVSDLHSFVLIFELAPTFCCKRTLRFDHLPQKPLCDIAFSTTHAATAPASISSKDAFMGFALCFRSCSQLELYDEGRLESQKLQFQLPVHRSAFDRQGFTLAVAEAGSIKTWISIFSIYKGFRPSTTRSTRRRFIAHVGKISGIQWTTQSSLLATSGYDGYVKLWDLQSRAKRGGPVSCIFQVHLDFRGVHSLRLLDDDPENPEAPSDPKDSGAPKDPLSFVAMGFTDCRLHARELPQLREWETTRRDELDHVAAQIQKIWKGRRTRELINQFIRPTKV